MPSLLFIPISRTREKPPRSDGAPTAGTLSPQHRDVTGIFLSLLFFLKSWKRRFLFPVDIPKRMLILRKLTGSGHILHLRKLLVTSCCSLNSSTVTSPQSTDDHRSATMSSSFFVFSLLFTVYLRPSVLAAPPLTIRNNGYQGLVVAIGTGVPEDPRIVDNIQALLISASADLYTATESRAFFRTVTVVVPANWTSSPEYERVSGIDRFTTAHIRVDRPNPEYGNNPYTLQPGGCGEPGIYIHLTPEFVSELHGITTEEYGNPGRTLVHEWAHLRYGVYDEYGSWDDFRTLPFFRDEDQRIRVTGCPSNISGIFLGPGCAAFGENGIPGPDCMFVPNQDNDTSNTSIMFMHFLPHADGFCGSSQGRPHDPLPPTKHNVLCQGRSTWEVIMSHHDFKDGRNPPRAVEDTRPKFRIIQPKLGDSGTFVLLLDVSGSMSPLRMSTLHRAATGFLSNQVPLNSHVAIVVFSSAPRTLSALTRMTDETRPQLLRRLPVRNDGGNTAIGSALRETLKVLREGQGSAEDAIILLITDGEENVSPYVRDVRQEVLDSGAVVHTVAFGAHASRHLEPLAAATGGRTFWYRDEENVAPVALQAALLASAEPLRPLSPVQITSRSWGLGALETLTGKVNVDSALGRNTRFVFTYTGNGAAPKVLLVPPGGGIPEVLTIDPAARSLTLLIPYAQPGNWSYSATSRSHVIQGMGLTVTSEARDLDEPVRARSWLGDLSIRLPEDSGRAKIFAEVRRGYEAVLNAQVIATVDRPFGDSVTVLLHDDGAGSDATKGDGIYTAYFALFNGTGRYGVTALAQDAGRALLRSEPGPGGSWALSKVHKSTEHYQPPRSAGAFERVAVAGSFRVDGWTATEDRLPPNRVTDLRALSTGKLSPDQDLHLDLAWTSPGDDMDQGLSQFYQIRFSSAAMLTDEGFYLGWEILPVHLTSGSLTPLAGGRRHRIQVTLPGNLTLGDSVYVALRAVDEAGNVGQVSNHVVIERELVPIAKHQWANAVSWMGIASGALLMSLLGCLAVITQVRANKQLKRQPVDFYGKVTLAKPS